MLISPQLDSRRVVEKEALRVPPRKQSRIRPGWRGFVAYMTCGNRAGRSQRRETQLTHRSARNAKVAPKHSGLRIPDQQPAPRAADSTQMRRAPSESQQREHLFLGL